MQAVQQQRIHRFGVAHAGAEPHAGLTELFASSDPSGGFWQFVPHVDAIVEALLAAAGRPNRELRAAELTAAMVQEYDPETVAAEHWRPVLRRWRVRLADEGVPLMLCGASDGGGS